MNRQKAIDHLKGGEKLTHEYWEESEFIQLKGDIIVDENGMNCGTLRGFEEGDMSFNWKIKKS